MLQKLRQKLSLLARKSVTKNIAGQDWTFQPVSLSLFYELKTTLEPMFAAIQSLFNQQDNSGDGKRTIHQQTMPDKSVETVTMMEPPSLEMVKFRQDRADQQTKRALDCLLGNESRMALSRILADSLRSEGERMSDDEALAFFGEIDLPLALEFLGAFIEVNAAVFGPLVSRAVAALKAKFLPAQAEESKGPQNAPAPSEGQS